MMLSPARSAVTLIALASCAPPSLADDLIFADVLNFNDPLGNSIRRVNTDGSGLVTLVETGGGVRGVDVDLAAGHIYWSDVDNFVIRRANLNGSNQVDIVTSGLAFPAGLRLSVPAGRIFWGDATNEEMYRTFLDGSSPQLMATTVFYRGLAVDDVNGLVYWTTSSSTTTGQILKSDFVGNGQQVVLGTVPISKPGNLALDVAGGKIYWTDQIVWKIHRANLDGTGSEMIHDSGVIGPPKGIAIDRAHGKLYYGQDIDNEGFQGGQIYKMNLDGSNVELVADLLGSVNDIVFVPTTQSCYANCDGSTAAPILNANDFQCFLNLYATGSSLANCDGSTAAPILNANDFQCFLNTFAAGCP